MCVSVCVCFLCVYVCERVCPRLTVRRTEEMERTRALYNLWAMRVAGADAAATKKSKYSPTSLSAALGLDQRVVEVRAVHWVVCVCVCARLVSVPEASTRWLQVCMCIDRRLTCRSLCALR